LPKLIYIRVRATG